MQILKVKTLHRCCVVLLEAGCAVLLRLLTMLLPALHAHSVRSLQVLHQHRLSETGIQPHKSEGKTTKSALEMLPQSLENMGISAEITPSTVLGEDGLLPAAVKSLCLQLT